METGGQYTGSRSYRVSGTRRGVTWKKRKRIYVNDSYVAMQQAYDFKNRVEAASEVVVACSTSCTLTINQARP